MVRRYQPTMADYAVVAISPALIITLVGSLVFFLLAVFYQGEFAARLHWVMACFVFAAVLISRIAIEEGFERASMFGVALAIPVGIAANRFIEVSGTWVDQFGWIINWGLIALIWWCAHKLTWDCTVIDESEDSSGAGLLQTVGFESGDPQTPSQLPVAPATSPPTDEMDLELGGSTMRRNAPVGWWQQRIERQRRPHAPGVWVVYFSLAALPLFGVGQWFIPATSVWTRRYVFWLLCIYVGSGLGLLLTTSFLGLRRYLRQRHVEMPSLMANLWLGIGGVLIGVLLLFAALLPRPSAEYAISQLPFSVGSPSRDASRSAPISQEGVKEDQPGAAPENPNAKDQSPPPLGNSTSQTSASKGASSQEGQSDQASSQDRSDNSSTREPDSQTSQATPSNAPESSETPDSPSTAPPDNSAQDNPPAGVPPQLDRKRKSDLEKGMDCLKQNSPPRPSAQQKQQQSTDEPKAADTPPTDRQRADNLPTETKPTAKAQPPGDTSGTAKQTPENPSTEQAAESTTPPAADSTAPLPQAVPQIGLETLSDLIKWIFYGALALGVAWVLWRSRREVWAAILEFLALLRDLLSGGRRKPRGTPADDEAIPEFPPVPFSSFADPFAAGIADQYDPGELVRYSFEAFEAWSREHGCPRQAHQTPHELARRVAAAQPVISAEAQAIAELYAQVAFAKQQTPLRPLEPLSRLWTKMSANLTPF